MTFGEKLQLLRKQNGLSQEQLASQLTVSRQAVSKWELNDSFPDTENIIQLSILFNVSTDYLLKDDVKHIKEDVSPVIKKKEKWMLVVGICCLSFSCISFFIIWILEKIYKAPITYYNPKTQLWKVGLENFIWVNGLENFMIIIVLAFILDTGLIFNKEIKNLYAGILLKLKRRK